MTDNRRTAIVAAMAMAAALSLATTTFAQAPSTGATASGSAGATPMTGTQPRGNATQTLSPGGSTRAQQPRANDPMTPPSGRGLDNAAPRGDALGAGSGAGTVSGGVPALGGVTPNRAELPASAFGKLDAANRGYLTLDDVRQLQGFDSAFRQADQNGDGRLNMSEFNTAWGIYTGNVR